MATQNVSITITTPQNMTINEALRLFSTHHGYQEQIPEIINNQATGNYIANPETRAAFTKRQIARMVREAILAQQKFEAEQAISIIDITVE